MLCGVDGTANCHVMHMPSAGSGPSMFQPFPPLPKSPFASPSESPKKAESCHRNSLEHKGTGSCNGHCKADVQGMQHLCFSPARMNCKTAMLTMSVCEPDICRYPGKILWGIFRDEGWLCD